MTRRAEYLIEPMSSSAPVLVFLLRFQQPERYFWSYRRHNRTFERRGRNRFRSLLWCCQILFYSDPRILWYLRYSWSFTAVAVFFVFLLLVFFISLIADGPHHYHPACGHKGSSHLSPVHALQFFYRDASSALLQLVNQGLNFTYSRSHAFRYERKNTNPILVRIELTTSVLADVQLTY